VTDTFPREGGWDTEPRREPRAAFCHIHAFYDCPICKGEEPVWVIPVENPLGQITGTVFVREDGSVTITGSPDLPEPPQTVIVHLPVAKVEDFSHAWEAEPPPQPAPTVEVIPRLPRPTQRQLMAAAALFAEPLPDGWVREAEARGRAVHDAAVTLAASEDIPYAEAIQRVLDERA